MILAGILDLIALLIRLIRNYCSFEGAHDTFNVSNGNNLNGDMIDLFYDFALVD